MKRNITLLFFLMGFVVISYCQEEMKYDKDRDYTFFGIGYGQMFINHKGLNFVVDRYNETRQGQSGAATLTKQMKSIKSLSGIVADFGFVNNKFENGWFFDLRGGRYNSVMNAKGINANGTLATKDVKLTIWQGAFDAGFLPYQSQLLDAGLGMGMDMYFMSAYARANTEPYGSKVMDEMSVGVTFFAKFNFFLSKKLPLCLSIYPYYFLDIAKPNFQDLNEAINPITWANDPYGSESGNLSHVGVQADLNFTIFGRKQAGTQVHEKTKKSKKQTKGFNN